MSELMIPEFDYATGELPNGLFVEASAGTGKTFSIAGVIAREIALNDSLRISQILVTTFTRNAAAELRDRVRRRMTSLAKDLRTTDGQATGDALLDRLATAAPADRARMARNLLRAVIEYDTATIATIHSICSKILALAGQPSGAGAPDDKDRIIAEVVNDALVSQADQLPLIDEFRLTLAVKARLSQPLTAPWYDTQGRTEEEVAFLRRIADTVEHCATKVDERTADAPSFDDLISRARAVLLSEASESVRKEFRKRYSYVIVDEAQDTDAQQWQIFSSIFPLESETSGALISVGDPKQSIYKFRGADIDAYREQRDKGTVNGLRTNFRSDQPLLNGLNDLFRGATFGAGIPYVEVAASENHQTSVVSGVAPVEVLACDGVTEQGGLARAVARRVVGMLNGGVQLGIGRDRDKTGPLEPQHIAVLVCSGSVGRSVETHLRRWGVPAVSVGTASVMDSETATHWRALLRAIERVSNAGRTRHVMLTPLFSVPAGSPSLSDDRELEIIQSHLSRWSAVLRRDGVAAMVTDILDDADRVACLAAGTAGERRLTDFAHIAELLHAETSGSGCSPDVALQAFDRLRTVDGRSELVSRRVESEADAVQIMTVHVAKGLQFPFVIVADLWKPELRNDSKTMRIYQLHHEDNKGVSGRVIDLGWVAGMESSLASGRRLDEALDEEACLLYVAVTRAEQHVTVAYSPDVSGSTVSTRMNADGLNGQLDSVRRVNAASLPEPQMWSSEESRQGPLAVAPVPSVQQTYRRTSFTGILEAQRGGAGSVDVRTGADEGTSMFDSRAGYASANVSTGVPSMPLARIPGGTYVGTVLHSCLERIDWGHDDLRDHVSRVVGSTVGGALRARHHEEITQGLCDVLTTPLPELLGGSTLAELGSANRLAELDFEMSAALLTAGVTARDFGVLLGRLLPEGDALAGYARQLDHESFNVPLAGLINGSIDALIRIPEPGGSFRLFVTDYKSNRLDREGDASLIQAYSRERMQQEMEHHHYPLQALIYGVAVHRYLRWRAPHLDPDKVIGGIAYFFVRGMVGSDTPVVDGTTTGIFTWTAPSGLWQALSDRLAGEEI